MRCCALCFGDRGLRKDIFPLLATATGQCSYCGTANVLIVAPRALSEYFELLISAYRTDANGELLVAHFRSDWGMFKHTRMDDPRAKDLLAEILDDGERVRERFSPRAPKVANAFSEWDRLRDELMSKNRYFPDVNIDLDRLELLLSALTVDADDVPSKWYRARIQTGEQPFGIEKMGAPPHRIASHGRANPAGIPYLYLGSLVETAISEIRPHAGETVCVADFTVPSGLKLVDLRSPRSTVSPFLLTDAEEIARLRDDLPFLERLGEELTRPVVPQAAAIDYTPSQYLCEFIKKCGFAGVIYRSSTSGGINLALFLPSVAVAGSVTQYEVVRVLVEAIPHGG